VSRLFKTVSSILIFTFSTAIFASIPRVNLNSRPKLQQTTLSSSKVFPIEKPIPVVAEKTSSHKQHLKKENYSKSKTLTKKQIAKIKHHLENCATAKKITLGIIVNRQNSPKNSNPAWGWYLNRDQLPQDTRKVPKGIQKRLGGDSYEAVKLKVNTYYYHTDHLGSSSYITDANGYEFEHIIHFPFGEIWVDEGSHTSLLGYKFTGKELDEETGYTYFGARYYDARTSTWLSTDPILGAYFATTEINRETLSLFQNGNQNPINVKDIDGRVNIFIAGFWDGGSDGFLSNDIANKLLGAGENQRLSSPNNIPNAKFGHMQADTTNTALNYIKAIKKKWPNEPINIIGHSFGGKAGLELANDAHEAGYKINLLVTLDPVTRYWPGKERKDKTLPWLNIYPSEIGWTGKDLITRIGGQWGHVNDATLNIKEKKWWSNDMAGHTAVWYKNIGGYLDQLQQEINDQDGGRVRDKPLVDNFIE